MRFLSGWQGFFFIMTFMFVVVKLIPLLGPLAVRSAAHCVAIAGTLDIYFDVLEEYINYKNNK